MPNCNRQRDTTNRLSNTGFTLIELLIAIAISAIMMTGVVSVYTSLTRSYTTETVRASTQQDLRSAITLMAQDIRLAGLNPLGTIGNCFPTTTANAIGFIADLDYNGIVTVGNNEQIDYFLNGTQLTQRLDNNAGTDAVLMENVTALNFTYDNPVSPSTIVINMTVVAPAGRDGTVTRELTERVRLRNQ